MSTYPAVLLGAAPKWDPYKWETITLFHGTTRNDANAIRKSGVDTAFAKPDTDFGPGFYLTSLERQARYWAWMRYYPKLGSLPGGRTPNAPVVLRFVLSRQSLAELESLQFFVRGSYDDVDYWSFVQHCRQNPPASGKPPYSGVPPNVHRASASKPWYDIVAGPVASAWKQRQLAADSDQISFHTDRAVKLLNDFIKADNGRARSTLVRPV